MHVSYELRDFRRKPDRGRGLKGLGTYITPKVLLYICDNIQILTESLGASYCMRAIHHSIIRNLRFPFQFEEMSISRSPLGREITQSSSDLLHREIQPIMVQKEWYTLLKTLSVTWSAAASVWAISAISTIGTKAIVVTERSMSAYHLYSNHFYNNFSRASKTDLRMPLGEEMRRQSASKITIIDYLGMPEESYASPCRATSNAFRWCQEHRVFIAKSRYYMPLQAQVISQSVSPPKYRLQTLVLPIRIELWEERLIELCWKSRIMQWWFGAQLNDWLRWWRNCRIFILHI
jgi:hypothetical protein